MPTYYVTVSDSWLTTIKVEAESEEEAIEKIRQGEGEWEESHSPSGDIVIEAVEAA